MNRRDFIATASAAALTGCATGGRVSSRTARFHVFSKMFQPPVTKSPEALCELMAAAGADGIQWTVRKGGHATPENAKTELPRLVKVAESFGLKCESICTGITGDAFAATADATILKVAADCGIRQFRTGYFFYDEENETFVQSMERFRRSFASLARLGEKTGVKAAYQNHSTWGPAIFGGVVWDIYECLRDLDPRWIGVEYDPMHAYFETYESWRRGFDLVAPWIASIDLKDFRYKLDAKNPKMMAKDMVAAGEGVVPWGEVRNRVSVCGVDPLYIVHFEYDFDKTDLKKTVENEIAAFRKVILSHNFPKDRFSFLSLKPLPFRFSS